MRIDRMALCLSCIVPLMATAPGCMSVSHERPLNVLVRDAETKKPIADSDVSVSYPLMRSTQSLKPVTGVTLADGIARLHAEARNDAGVTVQASAKGYLSDEVHLPSAIVEQIEPAGMFESISHRTPNVTIELYAEPVFSIDLIVPPGFHGLVKATLYVVEGMPFPPGQRNFRFEVSPTGSVAIKGSPVLRRVMPGAYRAQFADGAPLPLEGDAAMVTFHWLKRDADELQFVVGTKAEYDAFVKSVGGDPNLNTSAAGGKGGKGGGGGRHKGGGGAGASGGNSSSMSP